MGLLWEEETFLQSTASLLTSNFKSQTFINPLTLTADIFTAPWAMMAHSIFFESPHQYQISDLQIKSIVVLLRNVLPSQRSPISGTYLTGECSFSAASKAACQFLFVTIKDVHPKKENFTEIFLFQLLLLKKPTHLF